MDVLLKAVNLTKSFKQGQDVVNAVKSANIEIFADTINVITGKSGSGKTTFLNLLGGLENPDSGELYYNGKNFYKQSESTQSKVRGHKFGFVFQFFNLIPELTVKDNILVPSIINNSKLDKEYLNNLLDVLGIKAKLKSFPSELSGGEQQRVAIARAMLLKPTILFADEPTGNLDRANSEKIVSLLKHINAEFGTSIVMVTHDKDLISTPDQYIYIEDGNVSSK